MKTNSFKDLLVWQRAMELVASTYEVTADLPATERFGIASQMQRATVSAPSNIAEGYKRHNLVEYIQFCGIAVGSLAELETQLLITQRTYSSVNMNTSLELVAEVQKMLYAMIRQLKAKHSTLTAKR